MSGANLSKATSLRLPANMGQPDGPLQLGPGTWELRASTSVHVRYHSPAALTDTPLNELTPLRIELSEDTDVWAAADDNKPGRVFAALVEDGRGRGPTR